MKPLIDIILQYPSGIISIFFSLITVYIITPKSINYFEKIGLTTRDLHKKSKPKIASSAGLPVVCGICVGLLINIALQTFVLQDNSVSNLIFATITTILIITLGGFLDDLNSRQVSWGGKKRGKAGLKNYHKIILTLPAALPLMVINAGESVINLPFLGTVNLGILFPLLVIPIGVVGAANMINLLGGFNGLEIGMGIIYTTSLGLLSFYLGRNSAALIFLVTSAALIGVFRFNFFPAKILPGDSIQYCLGAVIVSGAVIGNIERAAIITMIPFYLEFLLKARMRFSKTSCLGTLTKEGKIISTHEKIHSLTHIMMRIKPTDEKGITYRFFLLQGIFAIIPWLVYAI